MNLKSKFFILTILMLLIPMIVIISNFYNYREDYYNKKEKENIENNIKSLENNLKLLNSQTESLLNFILREFNNENEEKYKTSMTNLIKEKKEYLLLYYALEDTGDFYGVNKNIIIDLKGNLNANRLPKNYDPRKRPWYLEAKNKGVFSLTNVYSDLITHNNIATFSMPIYKNNKFIGVMAFDIDLKIFSEMIGIKYFSETPTSIIDKNGYIIISTDQNELGKKASYLSELVSIQGDFVYKEQEFFYKKIENSNFTIISKAGKEDLFTDFEPLKKMIWIISIFSIILSITLILFLVRVLENFLKKLALTLENISVGKYINELNHYKSFTHNHKEIYLIKNLLDKMSYKIQEREKKLYKLANFDTLTNVYNRRYLFRTLEKKIGNCNENLIIALFDLDDFKSINDKFGHHIGDLVLKNITKIVKNNLVLNEILGRYGGEEFLIIFSSTSFENSLAITEKIRESIENIEWEIPLLKVTASFGVAKYKCGSLEKLIQEADVSLYEAKNRGKNRIAYQENNIM